MCSSNHPNKWWLVPIYRNALISLMKKPMQRRKIGLCKPLTGQFMLFPAPTFHRLKPESFAGVRKDLDSDTDVLDLMAEDEVNRFVGRNTNNAKRSVAETLVTTIGRNIRKTEKAGGDVTGLKAALALAEAQRDTLVAAMGDMKNSTKTLTSYQAMPAGIELKSRIIIDKASSQDLTTLMGALDLFSRSPVLGGQTARGCGA